MLSTAPRQFFRYFSYLFLCAFFYCQTAFATSEDLLANEYVQKFLSEYSPSEAALIKDDLANIGKLCFRETSPVEANERIYIATAGGPGTGKSTILENYLSEKTNFAYLDPDQRALKYMINTYLQEFTNAKISQKKVHTRNDWKKLLESAYTKWRAASNYITSVLLNKAYSNGNNIAHGTTSTSEQVEILYKKLKANGYKIVLLLCYSPEQERIKALEHRFENQNFIQVDPKDIVSKGKVFPERFPIYFQYADEIEIYWADSFLEGATLAARLERGKGITTFDAKAMKKFVQKYDKDRQDKPSLLPLSTFIKNFTQHP